jgi:tRNA(Ile)-lysidine synthetase-like protein
VLLSDAEAGLDLEKLLAWPVSLRRHALQSAVARVLGDRQELGQRHVDALERLAQRGRTGDSLDLPRGLRARRERSRLVLAPEGAAAPAALPECPVQLPVPGEVRFGHLLIVAAAFSARAGTTAVKLDAGAVGTGVTVRRRRPGDRMHPAGLTGTKKLQDILVDTHVPRAARDAVPVFENARGILWAGGVRAAEWARPRAGAPTVTLAYRSASADDLP